MIKPFTLILLLSALLYSCRKKEGSIDKKNDFDRAKIEQEILKSSKSVVWALNESNADTLLKDYWRSDSAKFIINGRTISGYNKIKERFIQSADTRKNLELSLSHEEVLVLSPESAIHIAEFDQEIIDLEENKSSSKGTWTSVYIKIKGEWKVLLVHESYYPVDQ